ncbi:hypothetical protein [Sphingomonas sp. Root241]|uniref:hypothetical protein n=1 Tax=Sphingomonas sp. Root241 TaxID=1736501 RepID=UPI0006F7F03C|nr:hypothetical protein [Sphingomonas sp. Root241]KRC82253.1 hypothetical protein ASE13_08075 [Sphingomonas sp. Root241]
MEASRARIAPEVIDCIAQDRLPSIDELYRVADRIRSDLRGTKPAFAWGEADPEGIERLLTLRVAQAALVGDGGAK